VITTAYRITHHTSAGFVLQDNIFFLFIQLRTAALRLTMRSWLDVPTFAIRRPHACHPTRAPSGGRWNCGRETSGNFAEMTTYTPFRDLLHAVKLRHGTDGFTSPPKEGVLSFFFFAVKIRRLRPGVNPRTWVPKASTLPLDHGSRLINVIFFTQPAAQYHQP